MNVLTFDVLELQFLIFAQNYCSQINWCVCPMRVLQLLAVVKAVRLNRLSFDSNTLILIKAELGIPTILKIPGWASMSHFITRVLFITISSLPNMITGKQKNYVLL
jgi:hypothetical protein